MVSSAVATPPSTQELPASTRVRLRQSLQDVEAPCSQEELERRARDVALAEPSCRVLLCEKELARWEYRVKVAPSSAELLFALGEETDAKRRLENAEPKESAIDEWARTFVRELCALHLFVRAEANKLRPCDGFPFLPSRNASSAA